MIKWPFISTEVNSAQTKSLDEDNIYNASSTKEHIDDHLKVSSAAKIQILAPHNLKKFSFFDLQNATRGFSHENRLGRGAFGEFFEGWIDTNTSSVSLDGPIRIAIRWFYRQNHLKEEFVDMTFLSEFNHPNLIKVLGYCLEDNKLFLVYEFMENGSLASHLFKDKIPLSWKTRVQIAKGVAEALLFLHSTQPNVKNRPVELHHILLDKNFNPKISGFESAKLVYGDSYIEINDDPLYYLIPRVNISVFEGIIRPFGIVLIHILTGESDIENGITKLQLQRTIQVGKDRKESMKRALDPRLPNVDDTTIKEATKLVAVALCCIDEYCQFTMKKASDLLRQF